MNRIRAVLAEILAAAREEAGDPWDAAYAMRALAPLPDSEMRLAFGRQEQRWPPPVTAADIEQARAQRTELLVPEELPPAPCRADRTLMELLAAAGDAGMLRRVLAERLACTPLTVARRLPRLRRRGWVESRRIAPGGPSVDRLTAAGWRAIGYGAPVAQEPAAQEATWDGG